MMFNFRTSFLRCGVFPKLVQNITQSTQLYLKQVQELKHGTSKTISGAISNSHRLPYLLDFNLLDNGNKQNCCNLCRLGLHLKHTDVLILSQYLRSDGCLMPRRITGLCLRQQKRISILVAMSQKAGLLSNIAPKTSKMDPKKRFGWKKHNKYYDENSIQLKY